MEMRVSSKTETLNLAAAITGMVNDAIETETPLDLYLSCIGMQATNQAVKAIAAALNLLNLERNKEEYIYITIIPFFERIITAAKPDLEVNRMKLKVIIL